MLWARINYPPPKKECQELANPHSYWVLLISVAIIGDAEKIWSNLFTGCQRNAFPLNKNLYTLDRVNARKSLKHKGFLAFRNTERVCMATI